MLIESCAANGDANHLGHERDSFARVLELCVSVLARFARPSATVFYEIGADREPSGFELFGMAETMHRNYLQRYCRIDPLHPSRCESEVDRVMTLDHALPVAHRDRSDYWRRFLSPYDVVDVVEVWLRDGERLAAGFSLLRMVPSEPFSISEIERIRTVQPLLEMVLGPSWRGRRPLSVRSEGSHRLTHREQQIACLVRDGLSNKEIGRTLSLTQPTIKTHLLRMFRKLGISSRTELVAVLFL